MNSIFRIAVVLTFTSCCAVSASAQQSYPMLMSVEPVAVQVGQTSQLVVKSRYTMEDAYQVLVSGDGVTGEVVLPKLKEGEKKPAALLSLPVRFTINPNATPGVRDFRIATPTGVSTVGQLVVVNDPVIVESDKNNTMESATEAKLPATLCGRIESAEDIDYFKFHVEAGDTLCFHVRCMRLQDRIHDLQKHADPILSIRNSSGSTIGSSDNVFAADPFLAHTFSNSGDYYLELRDVRYQGNQYWGYSVEVSKRPFVQTVFPLAVSANEKTSVGLIGHAVPDGEQRQVLLTSTATRIQDASIDLGSGFCQPIQMVSSVHPPVQETDSENNTLNQAQPLSIPGGVNGKIETQGDLDYFAFDAKKGERLTIEVIARRAGSSLDPHLRILNEQGGQQQIADDIRIGKRNFADSRIENWTVPADGKYVIEVRDLQLRGGNPFVYFLNVTHSSPHFELFADTDKTPLTPGNSGVVYVRVERKNGFDGEVQLQVDGLPSGVTAACGKILPGRQDGCIVFSAAADTKPLVQNVRIGGTTRLNDEQGEKSVHADATIYQETYQPGGGRGHWPVESHAVSVGKPGDIRQLTLSTHEIILKPGESTSIDVDIERAEGFDKNVSLEVTYSHLSTVYGDSLPQGVAIDKSASKVLLTAGASKGKITLTASKDAKPVERQQFAVMANVSLNFVMKATYASAPIYVTVTNEL